MHYSHGATALLQFVFLTNEKAISCLVPQYSISHPIWFIAHEGEHIKVVDMIKAEGGTRARSESALQWESEKVQ